MSARTSTRAVARETAFGETELAFPFSQDLVDDLKAEIPARYRRWDPEAKVWRVMGAYAPAAVDLLLAHFPRAEVPGHQPRRLLSSLAQRVRGPEPTPDPVPVPPIIVEPTPQDDQPPLDPILAVIPCPKCHTRHDRPIRVVAETSATVAKQERPPAELIHVCPQCHALAVVSFHPAAVAPAHP